MPTIGFWILVFSLLFTYAKYILGDRIREKIYYDFGVHASCMRRLNGTHEIGCSSSQSGDVGVLHYVRSEDDLQYVTHNGHHWPYTAVINVLDLNLFNVGTLRRLQDSQRIRGLILIKYDNESMSEPFSLDKTCPNAGFGLYDAGESCGQTVWNPTGNGMLFERWNFPIFLLHRNSDIDYLLESCIFRFNQPAVNRTLASWPLCSAELKSFMLAAGDSKTCIRRSSTVTNLNPEIRCDPLADFNVWASLNPVNKSTPSTANSTIIIAARMDTSGLFESHHSVGAETSVSGLVTLMLVAETLAKVRDQLTNKNIVFILFNGEAFDYIGSSRVVYDMQQGHFPEKLDDTIPTQNRLIGLEDISLFVELSQMGLVADKKFYLHSDPVSSSQPPVRDMITQFSGLTLEEAAKYNMSVGIVNSTQLPPASFQRFLKSGVKMAGVVVSDHQREYRNEYYNSFFDDLNTQASSYPADMADADRYHYPTAIAENTQKVATVIARSIYRLVTQQPLAQEASLNTSANLVYCYAYKTNCTLFGSFFSRDAAKANRRLTSEPLPLYVGANRDPYRPNFSALVTLSTLANLVGERVNLTADTCNNSKSDHMNNYLFYYIWAATTINGSDDGGYCVRTNAGLSRAESPAFLLDDYSGNYSTWTESVWSTTSIRIFLRPDPQEDINTLTFGIIASVIATVAIFFLHHRSGDIFLDSPD